MKTKFWFIESKRFGEVAIEFNGVTRGRQFFDRSQHGASHELWAGPLYVIATPSPRAVNAKVTMQYAYAVACGCFASVILPFTGI